MNDKEWIKVQENTYSFEYGGVNKNIVDILKIIKSKKSVLEVGCHNGNIGNILVAAGNKVVGIDLPKVIKAQKKKYEFEAHACDAEDMSIFPENTFDFVVAGELIEHLQHPHLFIEESYRVLKPGGLIILTTPNGVFEDRTHCRAYNREKITKELEANNLFKIIEIRESEALFVVAKSNKEF